MQTVDALYHIMADDENSEHELPVPPLVQAVCDDDLEQVRVLMASVGDMYTRLWALLKAINRRNTSIINILLDKRMYRKQDRQLWSYNCTMRYAYESRDISMVKRLLANGADPYNEAITKISTGRRNEMTDVQMEVLINEEMKFQPSTDTKECYLGWFGFPQKEQIERSLMCDAIRNGDCEMIRLMLEFDNCRSRSNDIRYLALFAAYSIGDEAKVEQLVKWCIADDRHFIEKQVERVILDGEIKHVKILLHYIADINAVLAKTVRQETPLILAVRSGRTDICDLFLNNSADINMASERYQDYMDSLPPPKGYPHLPALSRLTRPLLVALGSYADRYSRSSMASYLLSHGADPNLPDGEGKMPLHYAVYRASNETIKMLLQYGADVNPQDKSIGHTIISRWQDDPQFRYYRTIYDDKYFERFCLFIWAGCDVGVRYLWSRVNSSALERLKEYLGLFWKDRTEWVPGYRIEWRRTRWDKDHLFRCILLLLDDQDVPATCTSKLNLIKTLIMSGTLTRNDISKLYNRITVADNWKTKEDRKVVGEFISDFLTRGYSLQELCRLELRKSIQPPLWANIMSEHIELPKPLKAYLLDEEVPFK